MGKENKLIELLDKFENMLFSNSSIFLDYDELEEIILYYFNDGEIYKAKKAIQLAHNLYPKSINIFILESEILIQAGKIHEAHLLIDNIFTENKESKDLLFQKAKILNKLKKYKKSNKFLKQITESKELNFFILDLMLKNYMNLEDYHNAIVVNKKILQIFPDDKSYFDKFISCIHLSEKIDDGISFLNEFLEKNPYSYNGWYEIGKLFEKLNRLNESITAQEFAIISHESFAPSYLELGKLYEKKGDFKKSIYYYKVVMNLNKGSSFCLYRLSKCYEKIGEYDNSINFLNKIVENDPLYEKAWISIAKHYLRNNDHDKAILNLNKALEIISNNY